jgi:AcrR family transcriptional regulator
MRERATYHHGDLPSALVEAALAIVEEDGPENLSLREAARRVGVNHRAVYRHFEDKAQLLAAVALQGWNELVAWTDRDLARMPADDAEARLLGIGLAYVRFAVAHRAHFRVMFGPRLNEEGRFPELEAPIRVAIQTLERELRAGKPALRGDALRDAGIALWAAMHGLADLVVMRRVRVRRELLAGYVETVLRPTVRGILG